MVKNSIWAPKNLFMGFTSPSSETVLQAMNQTWKNDKKPNFGPDFGTFGPNLGHKFFLWVLPLPVARYCSKLSSYSIYRKTNKPNLRKW